MEYTPMEKDVLAMMQTSSLFYVIIFAVEA